MLEVEVIAKGSSLKMGQAQGEQLREKIRRAPGILAELYGFRMLQPAWMPYGMYRRVSENRARRFLEVPLKRDFPEAYLRMRGIWEESGAGIGLLHLFHALEPMLSDVSRCAIVPPFAACSAVAVRGRRSSTQEPIIARNFDYLPLVQPLYTLRESTPDIGFRSLDFTIAPFAGTVDGVNEKGLCIAYNYAYVNDFSGEGTAPISIAIAEALQRCATVAEAADWIGSRPRWGGGILMLADAAGDIASLELSNTRSQLRRPSSTAPDLLFHTNAFFTEKMHAVELEASAVYTDRAPLELRGCSIHESAKVRDLRFKELLEGGEPLDADDLLRIMSDHETGGRSGDMSICKHSNYWNTTASLQLFPASRRMRVAFDSACRAIYADFAL
jgi:hypothetical protein